MPRLVAGGAAAGGASLGFDAIARALGSPQPFDLPRAGLEGLLGAGGEGAEMAIRAGFKVLRRALGSSALYDRAKGALTEKGQELLQKVGIDPKLITREFAEEFAQRAEEAVSPVQAAAVAEAASLPQPVPLSQGDVSRDVAQQAFEDSALKGGAGEQAQRIMTGFREGQQDALRANVPAIQERLGGVGWGRSYRRGAGRSTGR